MMLDFLAEIVPIGPLTVLGALAGALLALHFSGDWKAVLGAIVIGFAAGIWMDNTRNASIAYLRRYVYGGLVVMALVKAAQHWLATH